MNDMVVFGASLTTAINDSSVNEEVKKELQGFVCQFADYIAGWQQKSDSINPIDENDRASMNEAKGLRKEIKKVRVDVDKKFSLLKEESLTKNQLIDKVAREIRNALQQLESVLEAKENYAERVKQEREERQRLARQAELEPLKEFMISQTWITLGTLSEEDYAVLKASCLASKKLKEEEEEKRIAKENEEKRIAENKNKRLNECALLGVTHYLESTAYDNIGGLSDADYQSALQLATVKKEEADRKHKREELKNIRLQTLMPFYSFIEADALQRVADMDQVEFNSLLDSAKKSKQEEDAKREREKALEDAKREREKALEEAKRQEEIKRKEYEQEIKRRVDLLELYAEFLPSESYEASSFSKEEFETLINEAKQRKKAKDDAANQLLKEKQEKEEQERKLQSASDKEKLIQVINALSLPPLDLKASDCIAIYREFAVKLQQIKQESLQKIKGQNDVFF